VTGRNDRLAPGEPLWAFRKLRERTQAHLRRVNAALSAWDEHDCAQAMPAELRPHVRHPTLSRPALKELQECHPLGGW